MTHSKSGKQRASSIQRERGGGRGWCQAPSRRGERGFKARVPPWPEQWLRVLVSHLGARSCAQAMSEAQTQTEDRLLGGGPAAAEEMKQEGFWRKCLWELSTRCQQQLLISAAGGTPRAASHILAWHTRPPQREKEPQPASGSSSILVTRGPSSGTT